MNRQQRLAKRSSASLALQAFGMALLVVIVATLPKFSQIGHKPLFLVGLSAIVLVFGLVNYAVLQTFKKKALRKVQNGESSKRE